REQLAFRRSQQDRLHCTGEMKAFLAALLVLLSVAADHQHLGPPVPAEVHRIVALAPSLTELVLALDARDRLVGVTRFDEDPRVQGLTRVGGFNDPGQLLADLGVENAAHDVTRPFARLSVEAAVGAAPDVLVLAGVEPPRGRPIVPGLDRVPVAPLRSQALLHPGPRLIEALDDLES